MIIDPALPLIDLHRHLDGSVRLQTILDLGRQYNLNLPAWELETLRPHVQVTDPKPDIAEFFKKFRYLTGVMVTPDACRRIAYENVEDALNEGIDYIELRFSPWFMAEPYSLKPAAVVEAVVDGVRAGERDFGVKANLIGILSRSYGTEIAMKELEALYSHRDDICALDLAGLEAEFPGYLFVGHFNRARNAGWHVTVHAGEAAGSESIWQAINELGAERLGHAVRAVDDPHLLDTLAQRRIGVESNLTSNVQTSVVRSYASHPLKTFIQKGILATINTDDPGISAIDLPYEYRMAVEEAGLSVAQVRRVQRNALEVAFLTGEEKQVLAAKAAARD